jgi:hypothetical protein
MCRVSSKGNRLRAFAATRPFTDCRFLQLHEGTEGQMTSAESSSRLANDFKRQLLWIALGAVVAACLAVVFLVLTGPISAAMVVAAALGTFLSFALGGGLMAAVFYSDSSGYDQNGTIASSAGESSRKDTIAASARPNGLVP